MMQPFLKEVDIIYCLTIPSRRLFVEEQIIKLNIQSKIKIIDAFTQDSDLVKNIINNNYVYPIYIKNDISVACSLGVYKILENIVTNKYNYAMVIEDDVLFLENRFDIANKWISKKIISTEFDINKPYVLHLISTVPESNYIRPATKDGIKKIQVLYGEPAYITNYHACELLLKYFYPITAPFDDYKRAVKLKFAIQQGILFPYICKELSANYTKFITNYKFVRSLQSTTSIFKSIGDIKFYLNIAGEKIQKDLTVKLIKHLFPSINIILADNNQFNDKMVCCINGLHSSIKNKYLIGCTLNDILDVQQPSFIISVNGKKSKKIIDKYNIDPYVGNILAYYSVIYPITTSKIYNICFVFDTDINVKQSTSYIYINIKKISVDELISYITKTEYVVSDIADILVIAHSYNCKIVYGLFSINHQKDIIMQDYLSNYINGKIESIKLTTDCGFIHLNKDKENEISTYPQPEIPINYDSIKVIINNLPFVLSHHAIFRENLKYVQCFS